MIKFLILSVCFGIFFFWLSLVEDANSTIAHPSLESVSTPVSLFLLGSGLCALAFWGKRTKMDE